MTDIAGRPALPPGLRFTETQRRALSTRLMLQAPKNLTVDQITRVRRDLDSRVRGLEPGMFMALDGLRLLADQGNEVAKWLFDRESARLGLTRPFSSYR